MSEICRTNVGNVGNKFSPYPHIPKSGEMGILISAVKTLSSASAQKQRR